VRNSSSLFIGPLFYCSDYPTSDSAFTLFITTKRINKLPHINRPLHLRKSHEP